MHPEFTALSLAVGTRAPAHSQGNRRRLAGLRREAEAAGAPERFDIAGYVPDPAALFAEFDIFGYPLCADNYSSLELVLQEAMFPGPPVVLPYGGAARTVTDGVTGIVATDEAGYSKAVGRLCADPELRARLGAQARSHAEARWSQAISGAAWDGLYRELLELPKRPRGWPEPPPETGAQAFIAALGPTADVFAASLAGDPAADEAIAASSPVLGWADGGVIPAPLPTDSHLHLWAGLVLAARGRRALAAGEFAAAKRAGLDPERVEGCWPSSLGRRVNDQRRRDPRPARRERAAGTRQGAADRLPRLERPPCSAVRATSRACMPRSAARWGGRTDRFAPQSGGPARSRGCTCSTTSCCTTPRSCA